MNESWDNAYKNGWDDRYEGNESVYDKHPNTFLGMASEI
jgi:hypothetical protein